MSSRFWRAGGNAIRPNSNFLADAVSATTWSPATDWTLTNTNLTAERTANTDFWRQIRATSAKTSGTFTLTVNALDGGSFPIQIGLDVGTETQSLGHDPTGISIGYWSNGTIAYASNSVVGSTGATYTIGDVITVTKAADVITFKKNGTLVWSGSITDPAVNGGGPASPPLVGAAYPAMSNGNGTGTKGTADFSGW